MKKKNIFAIIIILLTALSIFTFIVVKSKVASFTHDESFSYNHYVNHSYIDIISLKDHYTNNHLLNTFLMKLSEQLFGSSELALRLPNLLILLISFIYTYLFFKNCKPIVGVIVFGLMFTNVYFIDFFGLARGYGLSIGFMIVSIYHLIASFHQNRNKNLILFNITVFLSVVSNFTMLDYYVAALFVCILINFIESKLINKTKYEFFKINKTNLIFLLVFIVLLYEPVRKVVKFNNFDFGGKDGFIENTLTSIIYYSFYAIRITPLALTILKILFLATVLIPIIIFISNIYKRNTEFWHNNSAFYCINLILISISAETIVQHLLFKTDYIIGRFSLFLFPLFILNLGFLLNYLIKKIKFRKIIIALATMLMLLSSYNFYNKANLYGCAEWYCDKETKHMLTDLTKMHAEGKIKQQNVKLGIDWLFEPGINYYIKTLNLNWLQAVDRSGLHSTDDYYYIFYSSTTKLNPNSYTIIKTYGEYESLLLKNNSVEGLKN